MWENILGWLSGNDKAVYGYTLRGKRGRINYVGETNNPNRRAAQHRKSGKRGRLQIERKFSSRPRARAWEARKLRGYRRRHSGRNPRYNQTRNGGWKF